MSIRNPLIATLSLVALFAVAAPATAQDEEEFSSLEERMTGQEYDRAGLHKLSPEELRYLNQWLRDRSVAEYDRPAANAPDASEDRRGLPARDTGGDDRIVTRIKGTYEGWNGPTQFEMENGMVWETIGSGRYRVPAMENPRVVIERGFMMGSWYMQVGDYNRRVQVKRIE